MKVNGKEIKETIKCWCGLTATFHHIPSSHRNDGKVTIWYICPNNHKVFDEISIKNIDNMEI